MAKDTVILERRYVPEGTVVMHEGEPGNSAYLIQSGSVQVFTSKDEKDIKLAELKVGQIFGEMALIFDEPRAASVRAVEDCNLIVITRQTLKQKLESTDPTIRAIMEMLMKRIVSANNVILNKQNEIGDLRETNQIIFDNIASGLSYTEKVRFQDSVLPKLEAFMDAVDAFEKGEDTAQEEAGDGQDQSESPADDVEEQEEAGFSPSYDDEEEEFSGF